MPLSRADIMAALEALSLELESTSRKPAELVVVGGAAMVLLYSARESTKDVDAFGTGEPPAAEFRQAALRVATRLGLPEDWLNDAAKGYVQGFSPGPELFRSLSLVVRSVAPVQLLAMKLSAWRDDIDIEDARLLLSRLDGDRETIWNTLEQHLVPGRELKATHAFDDLWEVLHGSR